MRPLFFLSLAALLASAALAAPVPPPGPRPGPWEAGWEAVGPEANCRFDRAGGRLTISVAGPDHELDIQRGVLRAPRLTRAVEGDFDLEVRVSGDFGRPGRSAGLVLLSGPDGAVAGVRGDSPPLAVCALCQTGCPDAADLNVLREGGAVRLRLERRGQRIRLAYRPDGAGWTTGVDRKEYFKLPEKVTVGVFAASTAEGEFAATFDELKFTQKRRP